MKNLELRSDVLATSLLARISSESCVQPEFNQLMRFAYQKLINEVIVAEFPRQKSAVKTRMFASDAEAGVWEGEVLDRSQRAVVVDIARAGILPSQLCFETLSMLLDPAQVRQDHVVMARTTNEAGEVTGAHFGESKIGGDKEGAIVLLPDPMGATGSSLAKAVSHYKKDVPGKALKFIAINLIITPQYVEHLEAEHPDLKIYAARLDKGLNDHQYILPGAGGIGELMNNSYC